MASNTYYQSNAGWEAMDLALLSYSIEKLARIAPDSAQVLSSSMFIVIDLRLNMSRIMNGASDTYERLS